MKEEFVRTARLVGQEAVEGLKDKRVAIFGIGGVGGYVCEALVRSGVGHFDLVDMDTVSVSNINRQIIALHSTVGKYKTEVMKQRMLDINADVDVRINNCFFLPENAQDFDFSEYDYVVDAVDTVTAKIEIIMRAKEVDVPVISSMGAGNKLDPSRFQVADIYKTSGCPLAKVMRHELKKRGVKKLKVVYSDEIPRPVIEEDFSDKQSDPSKFGQNSAEKSSVEESRSDEIQCVEESVSDEIKCVEKSVRDEIKCVEKSVRDEIKCVDESYSRIKVAPGSNAFVPSVAGLIIAAEVFKDLIGLEK